MEGSVVNQVNYIDETSWLLHGTRQWLWVMANPAVAYCQIHPNRSKAAFMQRGPLPARAVGYC